MPNHFHEIIIIGDNEYNNRGRGYYGSGSRSRRDALPCVSTKRPDFIDKNNAQSVQLAGQARHEVFVTLRPTTPC